MASFWGFIFFSFVLLVDSISEGLNLRLFPVNRHYRTGMKLPGREPISGSSVTAAATYVQLAPTITESEVSLPVAVSMDIDPKP